MVRVPPGATIWQLAAPAAVVIATTSSSCSILAIRLKLSLISKFSVTVAAGAAGAVSVTVPLPSLLSIQTHAALQPAETVTVGSERTAAPLPVTTIERVVCSPPLTAMDLTLPSIAAASGSDAPTLTMAVALVERLCFASTTLSTTLTSAASVIAGAVNSTSPEYVASVFTFTVQSSLSVEALSSRVAPSTPVTVNGSDILPPASTEKSSEENRAERAPRGGVSSPSSLLSHETNAVAPKAMNAAKSNFLLNKLLNFITIICILMIFSLYSRKPPLLRGGLSGFIVVSFSRWLHGRSAQAGRIRSRYRRAS